VYILHSKKDGKLYTGFSPNLKSRFKAHLKGFVKATKHRRPLELIYYESFSNELDARMREKYLKGGNGRDQMKQQLKNTFDSLDYKYK